jgi:flagella basal body P-ring formation protein FlgA
MKFVINTLFLLLISISNVCVADVILRFQPHIDSKARHLGDVLIIENDAAHWANLPLKSHPNAGELITKKRIVTWMSQTLGQVSYQWQGKSEIYVDKLTQSSGKALQDKAQAELVKQLGSKYTRIAITALSTTKSSEYPLDSFKVKTALSFPVAKRVCVWLTNDKQRIAVWFRVRAYAEAWVARHNIGYNTVLDPKAFSLKERNIAGLNGRPAQSLPENTWINASLEQNKILLASQLKQPPLVKQGEAIKVSLHHNSINLVMDAIAMADGYLGQTIKAKNPINQKTFAVKVSGAEHAEVM